MTLTLISDNELATADLDTDLANAEVAVTIARARKAAADAEAAEAKRLADPFERAVSDAEASFTDAQTKVVAAIRQTSIAQAEVETAQKHRHVFVKAVLAGETPDQDAIRKADLALAEASRLLAFRQDVRAAADDAFAMAKARLENSKHSLNGRYALVLQENINAELRARVPNQPDDAALLAELARVPNFLAKVRKEADEAYEAAYHHWKGNPSNPIHAPRQRLIQEGQDWQAWVLWGTQVEDGQPTGWQNRLLIRQLRSHIAARDHFAQYAKLTFDDLVRMRGEDYEAARSKLPRYRGMIAPCVFAPVKRGAA